MREVRSRQRRPLTGRIDGQVREIERLAFTHQSLLKEKYNEFHR